MADDELRVRQLAYRIWESEGRPEGQQQRHWDMALKIVAAERASGNEARVEEVEAPLDETPILEDDLPLEDDEVGIQENRLPLDDPEAAPFDEVPFRDDSVAGQDLPVQDRGKPEQAPAPQTEGSMEPLPEGSATAERADHLRTTDDSVTLPDETDTSQVPGKTAKTPTRAKRSSAKAADKTKAAEKSTASKAAAKKPAAAKSDTTKAAAQKSTAGKMAAEKAEAAKKKSSRTSARGTTPKPKG